MKLRAWLAILLLWLFVFYNLERAVDTIHISGLVYIFVLLASGALALVPRIFRRIPLFYYLVFLIIIYLAVQAVRGHDIIDDAFPATAIELASIIISLFLVKQVAKIIWDIEGTIENLTFQQIGIAPRLYESTDSEDLYREIKRSRRFRHHMTVFVIRPSYDQDKVKLSRIMEELQKTMVQRYVHARLARSLSDTLRDTDLIVVENNDFIIMLPETTMEEADTVMKFITKTVEDDLAIDLQVGVAGFPDEAVTLSGLIDTALNRLSANSK